MSVRPDVSCLTGEGARRESQIVELDFEFEFEFELDFEWDFELDFELYTFLSNILDYDENIRI